VTEGIDEQRIGDYNSLSGIYHRVQALSAELRRGTGGHRESNSDWRTAS
jgi:hypothetical protein